MVVKRGSDRPLNAVERLCESMRQDRKVLEFYRRNFNQANRDYAGAQWSGRAADAVMPVNMLDLFVRAMVRNLVAKNPRFLLSTWNRRHEPAVKVGEKWGNEQAEEQRFDLQLRRWVFNSLFGVGVLKVALALPSESAVTGWRVAGGTPYMKSIDLDDMVWDTHAHDFSECSYIGHRFRVPLETVRESKLYDERARRNLVASLDGRYNEEGDERTSHIGRNDYDFTDELDEMVDLWSVYIRRTRKILTLAAPLGHAPVFDDGSIVLREAEWFGPAEGPYHFLELGLAPSGNPFPKAPGMDLIFPNQAINNLVRKLIGQAGRQKSLSVARRGSDEDATAVKNASDGEMLLLTDPASVVQLSFGGPDASNFQLFDYLMGKFDMLAGNLSTMLGLQPLAKTAKQEGMLDTNSSRSMADLQDTVVTSTSRAMAAWMWYEWNSPHRVMQSEFEVPGFPEYNRPVFNFPNTEQYRADPRVRHRVRSAKFGDELKVRVDPYSLKFNTPGGRAAALKGAFAELIMPMLPILQQQGKTADMDYFLDTLARYEDLPELARMMQTAEPMGEDVSGGDASGPAAGGPRTREYVRRSEAQGGRNGPDNVAAMMAAQTNTNGRPQ